MVARIKGLPPAELAELAEIALAGTANMRRVPHPGPQQHAYLSLADIMLYGGRAGGGKSGLGLLLALFEHQRSLIMRRRYTDLGALIDDAIRFNETRDGFNGSAPPKLRTKDGRLIQFGANANLGDEQSWQGQPFDLKVFDEATQFHESQIRFHLAWLRTSDPKQRVRAVLASNPPIGSDGDWIIGMFRPWLDNTHPNPAKQGELRWFVTAPDGKTDLEVDGPDPVRLEGYDLKPMSRTFIEAHYTDNPTIGKPILNERGERVGTDWSEYKAKLDSLREPLRSALRDGNFMAARQDDACQVIPTDWIEQAMARWTPDGFKNMAMTAMAIDPADGGEDAQVIAARYGGWFAELEVEQGVSTADPRQAFGHIMTVRQDSAPVVVDVGGGYGGKILLRLKDNKIPHIEFNGAHSSRKRAKGSNVPYANKRAEAYYFLANELDPNQPGGSPICLPPDPELKSDLAAVRYDAHALQVRGVYQVEPKDALRKRLGRSPGKGDAVVMCLSEGQAAVKREARRNESSFGSSNGGIQTTSNMGFASIKGGYYRRGG